MIYDFCGELDGNCALMGYYAAGSGNLLPTFRDNLSVQFFTDQEQTRYVVQKRRQKNTNTLCDIAQKSADLVLS